MKKVFPLLLLALLPTFVFTACSSDDDNDNESKDKYLSEIIVKEHEYNYGVADTYGKLYENYMYDSKGYLLKKKTNYYIPTANSRISGEYIYTYDNNNRVIERNDYQLSRLEYKYFYSYNSIDSVSEMKKYTKDGDLSETWTYEYDNSKRLSKATVIGLNSGYIHNYTYSGYNITDTTYSIREKALFGITFNEYDSHGNLTSNTWTNGDTGKKTQQKGITYEYNSNGKMTKSTSWSMLPKNLTYKDYTYNEDGTLHKIHISYSNKTSESDLIYEYIYKE